MTVTFSLVRPLVLSFWHRLRPDVMRASSRSTVTFLAAAAAYGLLFAFLARAMAGALGTVAGLSSMRGFASADYSGLVVQLVALIVTVLLGVLFVVAAAGSAPRSLDPAQDGSDLLLLVSQPVRPGAVIVSRALATALLDPLGLLLLGPPLAALAAVQAHLSLPMSVVATLPIYVGLRAAVQALALTLVLANRALLPARLRPESAAAFESILFVAGGLACLRLDPAAIVASFRGAPSVLEPLHQLVTLTAPAVPRALALALEGTVTGGLRALGMGWLAILAVLAVCDRLGSLMPAHVLAAQSRRIGGARALGALWDRLWPSCHGPGRAFALKDLVTAWRANLMMAPALLAIFPLALYSLHRFRPLLGELPIAVPMVPFLLVSATAFAATLQERAEGPEPPVLPLAPGRLAAIKALGSVSLTVLCAAMVLLATFPLERALPALPWIAISAALLAVILAELLAFSPGAASEVFTPGGLRTAALWSILSIGLASLAGDSHAASRLPALLLGAGLAVALWGRDRFLAFDFSPRDILVLAAMFLFASRGMALVTAFAASLGGLTGRWAALAATASLQLALGWAAIEYLRQSTGDARRALGLPADDAVRRAVAAGACGLALVALFGWLGGMQGRPGQTAGFGALGVVQMLIASALAPLAEECFFRALLQRALSETLGRAAGLLVASILFASAHAGPPSVTLLALGLVLGALFERRRSVYDPAIAHLVFNHSQVVLLALGAEAARVAGW